MTTESDDSSLPSGTPPETGNLLSMNLPIDGRQGTSSPPPSATKEAREKPPTPLEFRDAKREIPPWGVLSPALCSEGGEGETPDAVGVPGREALDSVHGGFSAEPAAPSRAGGPASQTHPVFQQTLEILRRLMPPAGETADTRSTDAMPPEVQSPSEASTEQTVAPPVPPAEAQVSPAPPTRGKAERPETIPARMLNEFVYCRRLFYYEFVEGVFVESADTLRGEAIHQRVDAGNGAMSKAKRRTVGESRRSASPQPSPQSGEGGGRQSASPQTSLRFETGSLLSPALSSKGGEGEAAGRPKGHVQTSPM